MLTLLRLGFVIRTGIEVSGNGMLSKKTPKFQLVERKNTYEFHTMSVYNISKLSKKG